jgi:hypothetical protein
MLLMQMLMTLAIPLHSLLRQCGFAFPVRPALFWQIVLLIRSNATPDQLAGIVASIRRQQAVPLADLFATIGMETHVHIITRFLSRIVMVTTFTLSLMHPDVISAIVLFDDTLFYLTKRFSFIQCEPRILWTSDCAILFDFLIHTFLHFTCFFYKF